MGLGDVIETKVECFTLQVNSLSPELLEELKRVTKDLAEIKGVVFECKDNSDYLSLATRFIGRRWKAEHTLGDGSTHIEKHI